MTYNFKNHRFSGLSTFFLVNFKEVELLLWLSRIRTQHSVHEDAGSIPGLTQWVEDLALLWLWCRLAATAPIPPLAWELSYFTGAAVNK